MRINESSLENVRLLSVPEIKQIQQTITQNRSIAWSWGARSWTNVKNRGLAFRVSGFKHKGNVVIWVNGSDYYDVELVNFRGRSIEMKTDIFFDDLINAIDGMVEKTETYDEDVTKFMEEVVCD